MLVSKYWHQKEKMSLGHFGVQGRKAALKGHMGQLEGALTGPDWAILNIKIMMVKD